MISYAVSQNIWRNDTVYVICGGPSLKGFDFTKLQGKGVVLAVNQAAHKLPFCDAVFTCDRHWFRRNHKNVEENSKAHLYAAVAGEVDVSGFNGTVLERCRDDGLSFDVGRININGNSGFGAMNLAVLAGSKRIVMMGLDLQPTHGATHWHGGYVWFDRNNERKMYPQWVRAFEDAAPVLSDIGVEVLNANPGSAVRSFDFLDLQKEFGV